MTSSIRGPQPRQTAAGHYLPLQSSNGPSRRRHANLDGTDRPSNFVRVAPVVTTDMWLPDRSGADAGHAASAVLDRYAGRGTGASGWSRLACRKSAHSAGGIGWRSSSRLALNTAALRGPGMMAATAGWASGNCSAAAASGTRWVPQMPAIAVTRSTIADGAGR